MLCYLPSQLQFSVSTWVLRATVWIGSTPQCRFVEGNLSASLSF